MVHIVITNWPRVFQMSTDGKITDVQVHTDTYIQKDKSANNIGVQADTDTKKNQQDRGSNKYGKKHKMSTH